MVGRSSCLCAVIDARGGCSTLPSPTCRSSSPTRLFSLSPKHAKRFRKIDQCSSGGPGVRSPRRRPRTSIAHTSFHHGAQAGSRAAQFSRRAQRGRRVGAATLDAAWAPWCAGRAMDSGLSSSSVSSSWCCRRETASVTSSPPLSGDRCGLSCASCEVHTSARARDGAVDRAVRSPRRCHRGVCPSRPLVGSTSTR